ncbi:MAG: hypothetical protein QX189_11985 [Methylococcales bacterium]
MFNRCLFIDSEGQKIKAAFTAESELKKIRQKSNLVCALLDDRGYKSKFDYDTLLPFYNRQALSSNACLAFISSNEGFKNEALNDLVISLQFPNTDNNNTINHHVAWYPTTNNPSTLGIVDPIKLGQLNQYTPEQLASVGDYLLNNRQHFESSLVTTITQYETDLTNRGISLKMAQNYAIALGGIVCLCELLNIPNYIDNLVSYTANRARHKQEVIKEPVYVADYFLKLTTQHCDQSAKIIDTKGELHLDLPTALRQLTALDLDFNEKTLRKGLEQHPQYLSYEKSWAFGTTRKVYFFRYAATSITH